MLQKQGSISMVLSSPHIKPCLLSRPNLQHGERRVGILDLFWVKAKESLRNAVHAMLRPVCEQCSQTEQDLVRSSKRARTEMGSGRWRVMLGLEFQSRIPYFIFNVNELFPGVIVTLNEAYLLCWSDVLLLAI